jgi:small subunit ribosomal protein S1
MSWTKRLKHPSEMLKKGDDVEAVILKIDTENQRLSLGIKQLQPNIWEEFFKNHVIGDLVTGRIVRLTDFGAFIEIQEGIEGLVHVSEIADERVEKPADKLALDGAITAKIIKMDIAEQKIGLSIKAAAHDANREDYRSFMTKQGAHGGASLGELAGHTGGRRQRDQKRRRGGADDYGDGEEEG